jgi:hypothetical protein
MFLGYELKLQKAPLGSVGYQGILYVWPELTNQFFKNPKYPQNKVQDGKIIENEGSLHLGV